MTRVGTKWSPEVKERNAARRVLARIDLSIPGLKRTSAERRVWEVLGNLDEAIEEALEVCGDVHGRALGNAAVVAFAMYRVPMDERLDAVADAVRLWVETGGRIVR